MVSDLDDFIKTINVDNVNEGSIKYRGGVLWYFNCLFVTDIRCDSLILIFFNRG